MPVLRSFPAFVLMALVLLTRPALCAERTEVKLAGRTMGTTYHITVVAEGRTDPAVLQSDVDTLLEGVNASMSTYRPDSEISRFNGLSEADAPFAVSDGFLEVMQAAREIFQLSGGAWDGTVLPLVDLWGFGRAGEQKTLPSPGEIERVRERVGFNRISVNAGGFLSKKRADVTVDLASIAKGYGVDQVARMLENKALRDFLVEIGGEIYASGHREDGKPWRVGINRPDPDAAATAVYKVVALKNEAMATSGDYRNFNEIGGRLYSHIIDPRTGYPVDNGVVSASVFAPTCTLADGLATAMMVMGPEKGIGLLDLIQGVEGLIVVRHADGRLENFVSKGAGALKD